jgi:hypothetical protein
MSTIVTRAGKGSALTHNEVDANFTNLNTDKVEKTGTDPVVISVNSSSDALRITQTGAGNALVVEDSTNPDSTPFVIDTSGNVITGSTLYATDFVNYVGTSVLPKVELLGSGISTASIAQAVYVAASAAPTIVHAKSRNATIGSHTIVNSGDVVGSWVAQGSDGTAFLNLGSIKFEVDGTPSTGDMPGRLVFSTTADGASSPTERMRIDSSGNVGIGTATTTARFASSSQSLGDSLTLGRFSATSSATGGSAAELQIIAASNNIMLRSSGGDTLSFQTNSSSTDAITLETGGGLSISRTAVTAPAAGDGNVFSGTYTPTLTNVTNVAASTAYQCQYMRVGNVVTVSGRVNIDATTTSTNTTLGVSLPIASNFASAQNAGGSFSPSAAALSVSGVVFADATNDRASFRILIDSAAANDYYFTFTYLVI